MAQSCLNTLHFGNSKLNGHGLNSPILWQVQTASTARVCFNLPPMTKLLLVLQRSREFINNTFAGSSLPNSVLNTEQPIPIQRKQRWILIGRQRGCSMLSAPQCHRTTVAVMHNRKADTEEQTCNWDFLPTRHVLEL